ncbi:MAG: DUF4124 domain-containing protein [Azonexus sp.]|jgi:hypothetical protein|uniref:DUF4124 domain-containing protein n=1 Tax=Azonexus sp. TaxID=1872668 RepID=UPI002823A9E7|nr:DUF4124 domain-containing protein [Azonexus sp.]MDR0775108.1 DUF4124 domain-containing protein [Azonexus sp.]
MKPTAALVLGIISALALSTAHAEIYQWKDASGRTVVSDTPPSGSAAKEANVIGKQQPVVKGEVAGEKPADAPKSVAEKDLDFKKRQQEARDKADKEAKEQKAEADRKENCERARRNLAAIESGYGVSAFDEKGERKMLDEAQRKQEMERYREFVAQSCK